MKKRIITIGRQFGSGGRAIGLKLSQDLNIAYYDKELIAEAAKESGLSSEIFEKADEKTSDRFTYAFSIGFSSMSIYTPYQDVLSNERLFQFQSNAIQKIVAKEDSCVLVGRCADYILRDHPDLLSFFIHNKSENRIKAIAETQNVTWDQAKDMMRKTDKSRASYYKYYTDKEWGKASSYHFSIDVSVLGVDNTVELIKTIIKKRF